MNRTCYVFELGNIFKNNFDRIFVLNLPYRTDRLDEIRFQLLKIGLEIGSGGVERYEAVRPSEVGSWPSLGARGCFLSHLGILKLAKADGLKSILIIEDDFDWSRTFSKMSVNEVSKVFDGNWKFIHGGLEPGAGPVKATVLDPEIGVMQTHFIALRGDAISRAADYLDDMTRRPAGSEDGGPMHVDGAYSWFRRDNPDMAAFILKPAIGIQRPSKTDIADLPWFDRLPSIAYFAGLARKFKAVLIRQ